MPQTTSERLKRWGGYRGVGEDKAEKFLEDRGYTLTSSWEWIEPSETHYITPEEVDAILFLMEEWDYGGLVSVERKIEAKALTPKPQSTKNGGTE